MFSTYFVALVPGSALKTGSFDEAARFAKDRFVENLQSTVHRRRMTSSNEREHVQKQNGPPSLQPLSLPHR